MQQPDIRPVKESGDLYEVFQDYTYQDITVPNGFRYDGATVPRVVWTLIGFLPDGIHRAAALVHDYLYETKEFNRVYADKLFLTMLKESGVKSWHANLAYVTVRIFGNLYWKD